MARVLIVDDEPSILDLLGDLLRDAGYETVSAGDGVMALNLLRAGTAVDVVITDAMMPRCGGVELIRRLRAQPALGTLPVVLLSAAGPPAVDGLGRTRFLPKPFELTELLATVARMLAQPPA